MLLEEGCPWHVSKPTSLKSVIRPSVYDPGIVALYQALCNLCVRSLIFSGCWTLINRQQRDWHQKALGALERRPLDQKSQWIWFGIFVGILIATGGSSRPDPIQNVILGPVSALLLIPALYNVRSAYFARVRIPALLLLALTAWMVIQLVPLPPRIWQSLPVRDSIAELDNTLGLDTIWRPISLTPFRGVGSLLGVIVPVASLLIVLSMKIRTFTLLIAILAIGVLNSTLGLLQVIGGENSPLYFYAFGGGGSSPGLFANENHSAVFSSIMLLVIARLAIHARGLKIPRWIKIGLAPAYVLILFSVLVTGSRAGFSAALLAIVSSGLMVMLTRHYEGAVKHCGVERLGHLRLIFFAFFVAVLFIIFAFLWSERAPAVRDILKQGTFEDVRWSIWPVLSEMANVHWGVGTGFGSFDSVYHVYEPTELLFPTYLNHAHNDWVQLAIEGGAPAILLLLCLLGWIFKALVRVITNQKAKFSLFIFWAACVAIIAAASVVDYPLRTPVFQALAVWLLVCLALDGEDADVES